MNDIFTKKYNNHIFFIKTSLYIVLQINDKIYIITFKKEKEMQK